MQIVTLSETVPVIGGDPILANVPYLVTNGTAGLILNDFNRVKCRDGRMRSIASIVKLSQPVQEEFDPFKDWNGHTIWLFRAGGWGDIMFLTPTIRELKRRWPDCEVVVVCAKEYQTALKGVDCRVETMLLRADKIKEGDFVAFYEGTIEDNERAEHIHAVDLFAEKFGIKLKDRRLDWHITQEEVDWAMMKYPKSNRMRVGIQVAASSPVRTYHTDFTSMVSEKLNDLGCEVVLFGRPGQIKVEQQGVINLSSDGLTMRQSCSVLATCDAFIAPDSSLFHVAQAIGVPLLGLFGPFRADLRITNPASVRIIQARGECAPCFFHSMDDKPLPDDKPCTKAGFCTVLAAISPDRIVAEVMGIMGLSSQARQSGCGQPLDAVSVAS